MKTSLLLASLALCTNAFAAGKAVTYMVNGDAYEGYLNKAEGTSKGTVVLVHDWDGLTEYEVKRTEMLAKMGYDTFAIDVYGKGNRPNTKKDKKAEVGKLYGNREKMRNLLIGGLAEAQKHASGDVVVAGYCFGGAAVLELARSGQAKDVVGYATFHGGLKTPKGQKFSEDTPPLLIAHGGADASIPMEDVAALSKELEAAKVRYDIEVYSGAPHAFTVFGSNRYREAADQKSWQAFSNFLTTSF